MTATRNVRQVAHWRLAPEFNDKWTRVRVPALNPDKSLDNMIFPPLPGRLPAYELLLEDESEKESFRNWVFTLDVEDQEKIRAAIILERMS